MNIYIALFLSSALALSTTSPSLDILPTSTAAVPAQPETLTTISTLVGMQNSRRADGPPTVDSLEPLTTATPHPPAPPGRPPSLSDNMPRPTFSSSHFSMPPPVASSSSAPSGGLEGGSVGRSSAAFTRTTPSEPVTSTRLMPPPPPSTPSIVSVLWQPSSNAARSLSVPKVLVGLLSLRGVTAYNIIARDHPSFSCTSTPNLSLSLVPHTITPTSYPSTPLAHLAHICPEAQVHCGTNVCYDPKVNWCCRNKLHVCALGESCAEAKASEGELVYGCAPSDAENGTDLRIRMTAVRAETPAATGATMIGSASAEPTRSAGNKLGVPSFVQYLGLLVRGEKNDAFASAVRPECCGEKCCKEREVCTRSSDGAKCWPQAQRRDEGMVPKQETKTAIEEYDDVVEVASEVVEDNRDKDSLVAGDKKGGGGRGGGGSRDSAGRGDGGAGTGGGRHGNGAARPVIPTTLYIFLLLLPSAIAHILLSTFNAAVPPQTMGNPQIDPDRLLIAKQSQPLYKRWSCHKPRQDCGQGWWDPAKHVCCIQPSGSYGLCAADQGQSFCRTRCCTKDTYCQNKEGYTCVPKKVEE